MLTEVQKFKFYGLLSFQFISCKSCEVVEDSFQKKKRKKERQKKLQVYCKSIVDFKNVIAVPDIKMLLGWPRQFREKLKVGLGKQKAF